MPQGVKQQKPLNLLIPLVMALVLSGVTLLISNIDFRLDESTLQPILTFPPTEITDLDVWEARSQKENTEITTDGLTIWSKKPQVGIITARLPWDADKHRSNAYVIVKATVSTSDKAYGEEFSKKHADRPSLVIVRPTTEDKKERLRNFLFEPLSMSKSTQQWRTVTQIDDRTANIDAHMLLRSPGAWTLEALEVYSFSSSLRYLLAFAAVLLGWVLLFGFILKGLVAGRHWWLQIAGVVGLIGIGLGAGLSRSVLGFLGEHLLPLTPFVSNDQLGHVLGHFILSIGVFLYVGLSWRSIANVVLINLVVAMFVECVQAHLPHRSTSIEDIVFGMLGALIAIALALVLWLIFNLVFGKRTKATSTEANIIDPETENVDIEL